MMTEEHPEELIDRARRGALGPEEQAKLEQHLAICAACMEHLDLGPRFERELASQPRDELLVAHALDAAMPRMQRPSRVSRGRSGSRLLRFAAAAVLLASGLSVAGVLVVRRLSPPTAVDSPAKDPPARPRVEGPVAHPEPATPPPPAGSPELTHEATVPAPQTHPAAVRPTVTAATVFERAGKLRREGHADAAIAAYRRLQEMFPEARETRLSFALAGALLLERGRPGDALAQLDRHPRTGGDVDEETLVGRATALEQLHRTREATAAWQSLLARYPGSIYAARARARLEQLGTRQ